jgi:hypothetical protein
MNKKNNSENNLKRKKSIKSHINKHLSKVKDVKINKVHLFIGLLVLTLVILSYYLVGDLDTSKSTLEKDLTITIPFLDITFDFKVMSLLLSSIVIGLLDGFNPCAMWVLIYLISLASTIGDRKKMYLIVGTFVMTEAIMYFLVLAGWLNLFKFIGISTIILYVVGIFALWTGFYSIYDYYKSKGEVVCKVGDLESKQKTRKKIQDIVNSPLTLASLFAVILLAIVVNSFEFVCSAGLPAVFTQLLAIANISDFMRYFYIFVYDFFFMLDDFIIFALAIWAINSDWTTKYAGFSKIIGGIIMVFIGILLLFFPGVLF